MSTLIVLHAGSRFDNGTVGATLASRSGRRNGIPASTYPQYVSLPRDNSLSERVEAKLWPSGAEWDWYSDLDTDRLINVFAPYRLLLRSQSPSLHSEDGSIATEPYTGPGLLVHHGSQGPKRASPSFDLQDGLPTIPFPPRPNVAWTRGQDRGSEAMERLLALYTSSLRLSAPQEVTPEPPTADTLSECEDESPLFSSIRRVLSTDSLYSAEEIISAIKKQSADRRHVLSSSKQFVADHPISNESCSPRETPSGQASAPRKRGAGQTGRQSTSASKKSKTSMPPGGNGGGGGGDGDDGSGPGDGGGGGGDKGGRGDKGAAPPASEPKMSQDWKCPYGHRYPDISFEIKFRSCGRPGFHARDDFWTHLWKTHSPVAKPPNREDLAKYYMDGKQYDDLKLLMSKTKRVSPSDRGKWIEAQLDLYQKVWAILFPQSQHIPDSPFHVKYDKLREHCLKVVKALMKIDLAQSTDSAPSGEDDYHLSRQKVEQMLVIALHIGLDAHPGAAEVFGSHAPEQRDTTAIDRRAQAAHPPADAQQILEDLIEDSAADHGDDGIMATPVNTPETKQEAASLPHQTLPTQARPGLQTNLQMVCYKTQVPLYDNGENKIIIRMKPKGCPRHDQPLLSAQLQLIAPLAFEPNITAPKPNWTCEVLHPAPPPNTLVNQGGVTVPPAASVAPPPRSPPPTRERQAFQDPAQNTDRGSDDHENIGGDLGNVHVDPENENLNDMNMNVDYENEIDMDMIAYIDRWYTLGGPASNTWNNIGN